MIIQAQNGYDQSIMPKVMSLVGEANRGTSNGGNCATPKVVNISSQRPENDTNVPHLRKDGFILICGTYRWSTDEGKDTTKRRGKNFVNAATLIQPRNAPTRSQGAELGLK